MAKVTAGYPNWAGPILNFQGEQLEIKAKDNFWDSRQSKIAQINDYVELAIATFLTEELSTVGSIVKENSNT